MRAIPPSSDEDDYWMQRAIAEAERGQGFVEPNPMVGAVVVRDGRLVSYGHHGRFGGPHAEVVALDRAGDDARGSTLYVNLEPCCHQGKTPPCTAAIIRAGVDRVVTGMVDPFASVAGRGIAELRENGIQVDIGPLGGQCARLNAPFLKRVRTGRPYVVAKWAMSLDGKIATSSSDSRWISNARSRMAAHVVRGRMDAIIVGIGTVCADDPLLTPRPPGPRVPTRVVLDSHLRISERSKLVQTARENPVLIATTELTESAASLQAAGCGVLAFPDYDQVPIDLLLEALAARGATNVLVEGGARVLGAFYDADAIDEVDAYIAPKLIGGDGAMSPLAGLGSRTIDGARGLSHVQVSELDGDLRVRGVLDRPWMR